LAPSSNAHTYRLLIVKELIRYYLQLVDKALCLPAAKKEEYEAFRLFRQLLFSCSIFSDTPNCLILRTKFAGRRTIANRNLAWQGSFDAARQKRGRTGASMFASSALRRQRSMPPLKGTLVLIAK
jgi:hypothetical protein